MSVGAVNKQTGDRIPTAGMPAIDAALSGSSTNPVQNMVVKASFDAIKDGQSINSFADVETALGEKADTDIVASDFSTAVSYTAGDYCIYEGKFYKFKTSHSGAWSAADVDEIKIAGELSSLKSGLTGYLNTRNATSAVIASIVPGANIIPVNFASIIPPGMKPRFIGYNGNDKTLNVVSVNALQPLGDSDTQANIIVYNPTDATYTDVTVYACLGLVKA